MPRAFEDFRVNWASFSLALEIRENTRRTYPTRCSSNERRSCRWCHSFSPGWWAWRAPSSRMCNLYLVSTSTVATITPPPTSRPSWPSPQSVRSCAAMLDRFPPAMRDAFPPERLDPPEKLKQTGRPEYLFFMATVVDGWTKIYILRKWSLNSICAEFYWVTCTLKYGRLFAT